MSATDKLIKSSYYKLNFGGTDITHVTNIDIPTQEYELVEHTDGTQEPRDKSQGIPKVGDMVVEKDMSRDQDTTLYDNYEEARDTPDTGEIKKEATLFVKNVNDETIWKLKLNGCWVKEYNPPTLTATESGTLTETFTISIDHMQQEE